MESDISRRSQLGYGLKSVTGPRALNEDCAFIREYASRARPQRYICMASVADGMGGHQAGEVASSKAIESLFEEFNAQKIAYEKDPVLDTRQLLQQLFSFVNTTVYDIAKRDNKLKGMGTTLTAFLAERDKAYVGHVGDSRAYLVRGGSINQITEDHTLVQDMVRDKIITQEQAQSRKDRNVITRAIGLDPTVEIDVISFPIQTGDILFLCTDGLYDVVGNHEILISLTSSYNLQEACQELVQHALEHGASDNVSAVAWAVPEVAERQNLIGTTKASKTATGTLMLPPERSAKEAAAGTSVGEKPLSRATVIAIFAIVVVLGFVLGWLVAGWVKGGGEKRGMNTPSEPVEPTEEKDTEPDLAASFREETTIKLLDSADSQGGQAETAKSMLEGKGYKKLSTGKAKNDSKTTIYYGREIEENFGSESDKMFDILMEDLGMLPNTNRELRPEVSDTYRADIVIVLAPGWEEY